MTGQVEAYTEALLDPLDEYDIKGILLCSGRICAEESADHPEGQKEGHLIGIHSVNHQNALFGE